MFQKNEKTNKRFIKLSLKELFLAVREHSVSMQRMLLFYICMLLVAGTGILVLVLYMLGSFTESGKNLKRSLDVQLKNSVSEADERFGFLVGNSFELADRLSSSLEKEILTYPYDIKELDNSKEKIFFLQANIYPLLENQLQVMHTSGVFAVFDATVNTEAPNATDSRTGLYLRFSNISGGSSPNNEVFLFRGDPDVAGLYRIQLHNRWNLEFNIKQIEWYESQIKNSEDKKSARDYIWAGKRNITNVWEDAAFLSVPIVGSNGDRYGVCGVEISSLLYSLRHPIIDSDYGNMITVLAPIEDDNMLCLTHGLVGETRDVYVNENERLNIKKQKYFNVYEGKEERFIGVHRTIKGLKGSNSEEWVLAVLLPYSAYEKSLKDGYTLIFGVLLCFIFVMLVFSYIISQKYVKPIVNKLEELKNEEALNSNTKFGISEIDALAEFMKLKQAEKQNGMSEEIKTPSEIDVLFDAFISNANKLTVTEKTIFGFYIKGYEIADIPELAFISLNTVRKHNRSIYEKLNIKSKDELQLYIELLKRCNRIDEIEL